MLAVSVDFNKVGSMLMKKTSTRKSSKAKIMDRNNLLGASLAGLREGDTVLYCGHEAKFLGVTDKGVLVDYAIGDSSIRHFVPRKYISRI